MVEDDHRQITSNAVRLDNEEIMPSSMEETNIGDELRNGDGDGQVSRKRHLDECDTSKVVPNVRGLGQFLQTLALHGEFFGRRRPCGGTVTTDGGFKQTIQYYCRKSTRVMGKEARSDPCAVQLLLRKYSERQGWQVEWRGVHNHAPLGREDWSLRHDLMLQTADEYDDHYECLAMGTVRRGNAVRFSDGVDRTTLPDCTLNVQRRLTDNIYIHIDDLEKVNHVQEGCVDSRYSTSGSEPYLDSAMSHQHLAM